MFEKNQPSAMRRSGDEFLRRMNSGDLPGRSLPTMNIPSPAPLPPLGNSGSVPGNNSGGNNTGSDCSNGNGSCGCNQGTGCADMPALAMVYSPVQEWKNLLDPQEALMKGSLFCDLVKPFMGRSIYRGSR